MKFLEGGGDSGRVLRSIDWTRSPLGDPSVWSLQLRTLVGVMLEAGQGILIVWGPEQITLYNDKYAEMLGARHPSAMGQRFCDVWYEIWDQVDPIISAAYEGRATQMDDIGFEMLRNGYPEEAHFSFSYTPVRDEQGEVMGMFCACSELTQRVNAEREVMARAEETEERLRQAQKMEAVGQLTGGIAHDFNNMLQGIVMPLQLIRKRVEQARYDGIDKYVEAGIASARRASSLTQRLLAFSRRQALDQKVSDVAMSIHALEPLVRTTCGENVGLNMHLPDALWRVRTDTHQFESALLNLVINARDAMPDGGSLSLRARNLPLSADDLVGTDLAPGDYVEVSVADSGIGMPPDIVSRAFDPFFTTKPIGQGTGLGLSMVYGYIRQSGGYVLIDSTEGEGTTIRLRLPRAEEDALPDAESPDGSADTGDRGRRGQRVLVAEDDEVVRMLVVDLLRDRGYGVIEAVDGTQAMAILAHPSAHFDILLTDVGLPGPNGRQVADYARERMPEVRILLMTGYAAQAATDANFLGPDMGLIIKPFDPDALMRKVAQL